MAVEPRLEDESSENTLEGRELVTEFTVDMILLDLAHGRNRNAIAARYKYIDAVTQEETALTRKDVDLMFKDPALVGKTPSKGKRLGFAFAGSGDNTAVPSQSNITPLPRAGKTEDEPTPKADAKEEAADAPDPVNEPDPQVSTAATVGEPTAESDEDFSLENDQESPEASQEEVDPIETDNDDPITVG